MSGVDHLTGWRLSAGDGHVVYDARNVVIANVQCGGMTGRTFDEASDVARLIEAAPDMRAALHGLNGILGTAESNASGNPEWEHVSARINAARAAIAKATGK